MIQGFEDLNEQQFETLKNGISLITVLIAGADGEIDESETSWAKKVTEIRSYSLPNDLVHFYKEVGKDFSEKLHDLITRLPRDKEIRNEILQGKIAEINDVLLLLDNHLAVELYNSYKSFAMHVAKSSGGFLGMMSISAEEEELVSLPTLKEILPEESAE